MKMSKKTTTKMLGEWGTFQFFYPYGHRDFSICIQKTSKLNVWNRRFKIQEDRFLEKISFLSSDGEAFSLFEVRFVSKCNCKKDWCEEKEFVRIVELFKYNNLRWIEFERVEK